MTTDGGGELDSALFTDISASYNPAFFDDSMTITLGVNNVLDEDPPYVFDSGTNTDSFTYDSFGMYWYARLTFSL